MAKANAPATPTTSTVTTDLEQVLLVAMLTPMHNPNDVNCRWGAPTILWGAPGIGKSGRMDQVGHRVGLPVGTVYLSTHQPEDISGVLMPDSKGGAITICSLPQVNELIAVGKGILFLDELTCARPAMQGAGLGLIQERFIAGRRLPGRIRVLAAANPPEDAAGGWNLSPPTANRFLHLDVGCPSVDEWNEWLLTGDSATLMPISEGEDIIRTRWSEVWPKIAGLGAGFMRNYRTVKLGDKVDVNTLHHLPRQGSRDRGRAWASPRSWFTALRCLAAAECLGQKRVGHDLLEGCVGPAYSASWAEWVARANLPDPKDVLENGWTIDRGRMDITFAVLSSAISFALSRDTNDEKRRYALLSWKLLQRAVDAGQPDIALAPARSLVRGGFGTRAGNDMNDVARPIIRHFGETGMSNYAVD